MGGPFGCKPAAANADKEKDWAKPSAQPGATSALGASTNGPTSQIPRLKNKTMEDIVTRWASDLSKYQKEFKEQATTVSTWDRNLVDNGEKIQKLYLDTFEAERASHEIERQLAAVESQQEELEAWLNRYETEVHDMFAKQMGPGEQLAGPDQERERTYKLAEKLTQQLDEKSRDLSKMVKEINDISGTLTKGAKCEDPVRRASARLWCATVHADGKTCTAEPDCARTEQPPHPATVDRRALVGLAGQGCCCAKVKRGFGKPLYRGGQGCSGKLLPLVHGTQVKGHTGEGGIASPASSLVAAEGLVIRLGVGGSMRKQYRGGSARTHRSRQRELGAPMRVDFAHLATLVGNFTTAHRGKAHKADVKCRVMSM